MASRTITEMVGKRFGRLTVLDESVGVFPCGKKARHVVCRCDCGTVKTIDLYGIFRGAVVSCGCYHKSIRGHVKETACQCGETNPANFYEKSRSVCKVCVKIRVKNNVATRRDEVIAYQRRYRHRTIAKKQEANKKWAADNREKMLLCRRSSESKRRAAKLLNPNETVSYNAILKRDGMKCHICLKKVARRDLSFDHLIPLSRGGAHANHNIAVAHLNCNVKRGAGRIPAQLLLVS